MTESRSRPSEHDQSVARQRDEDAIRPIVISIPLNADLGAFDAIQPLFADRIRVDYTSLFGGEVWELTPAELMARWRGNLPGFDVVWHELTDLRVRAIGESGEASCSVNGRLWIGERYWRVNGRYDWKLIKQQEKWKVLEMTFTRHEDEGRDLLDLAMRRIEAAKK
jgi:SnoaL-like domain